MNDLRTAAQQALEALEDFGMKHYENTGEVLHRDIYEALKAALAEEALQRLTDVSQEIEAALAEPVEPVQEPGVWTPVTDALPQSGVKVLACYRNRLGNLRRIRAMWTAAKTEEASSEDAEACSEYDEATDTYYVTEGWYECIDNWGDYSSVAVTEGEVTHWMPLPPDPDSAPPKRPAEPVQEPVAWLWQHRETGRPRFLMPNERTATDVAAAFDVVGPLYLAPPQRLPLTEKEIKKLLIEHAGMTVVFSEVDLRFARAIERAHGIGGQP